MKFNIIALILCFFLVATAFTDAKAINERIEIKTTLYPKSTSAEDNSIEIQSTADSTLLNRQYKSLCTDYTMHYEIRAYLQFFKIP